MKDILNQIISDQNLLIICVTALVSLVFIVTLILIITNSPKAKNKRFIAKYKEFKNGEFMINLNRMQELSQYNELFVNLPLSYSKYSRQGR